MADLSRRDFLKLGAALTAGAALPMLAGAGRMPRLQPDKPNILILVLDAMAARNLSLYGYPRQTTPNLERLAARATVYHSHYSAGNFTTSGTAALLMGLNPWSHRGINLGGLVHPKLAGRNVFRALTQDYYTEAFAQNYYANLLLGQYQQDIDQRLPVNAFAFPSDPPLLERDFPHDPVTTFYALDKHGFYANGIPSAPLFEILNELRTGGKNPLGGTSEAYPYGSPDNGITRYKNPTVYDGVFEQIMALHKQDRPYFAYIHLFSPHEPYAPRKRFVGIFEDIPLPDKPAHRLSSLDYNRKTIKERRTQYDEYLADVDHEIGRLVDGLEAAGVLDNTYLVLTSDHGELFERGEYGHVTRFLYEAVIHVPLLILAPGQTKALNVYSPTSHIDLAPSLLTIAGTAIPDFMEGQLLPGLGGGEDGERPIFCLEAKESSVFSSLPQATVSMRKGDYKLIYYTGYPKVPDLFELYDLRRDPEELQDLFEAEPKIAARLRDELLQSFEIHRRLEGKL